MQIPVYKSQLRPTSEAPGARITARMNAQPFVNAALQKGAIGTEIINQVGEYANMRYKMIVETQKNEAIFSAKEALMGLSSTLEKSTDFANIFDGENKYKEGVNGVYDEMRAIVGKNKYALQDFDNSFRQMEIPIKFRLKEVVDIRIEKRRQAALKALQDQQIATLSDPNLDMTVDELAMSQAGLTSIHNRAVAAGGINPEIMGDVSQKILSKALENLIPAYAGKDLSTALDLVKVLNQIDLVRKKEIDPSDIKVDFDQIPPHVLNMLQAVPAEEAAAVVQNTLKMATSFFSAQEKLDDENEEEQNKANKRSLNAITSLDLSETVSQETLKSIMSPARYAMQPKSVTDATSLAGYEVKKILTDDLEQQFWLTPEQNRQIDKDRKYTGGYASESNPRKFNFLYDKVTSQMLTTEELNENKPFITAQDYRTLRDRIFSQEDKSFNDGSRLIAEAFRYNVQDAEQSGDKPLANASRTAYESAVLALREETTRRVTEQNPMTLFEVRKFAQAQVSEFGEFYIELLREEYQKDLREFSNDESTFTPDSLESNYESEPLKAIDEWWESLSAEQQRNRNLQGKKRRFISKIKASYAGRGIF